MALIAMFRRSNHIVSTSTDVAAILQQAVEIQKVMTEDLEDEELQGPK
jgi:hypothetical protein